jgi:hypothetical protein
MFEVYLLAFTLLFSHLPTMLNIIDLEEEIEKQQKQIEALQKNSQHNAQKPQESSIQATNLLEQKPSQQEFDKKFPDIKLKSKL